MNTNQPKKPRPYWHVDAKWLTGIPLLVLLNITFLTYIFMHFTSPEQGISLLTLTLASSYSAEGGGMDSTGDIEIMRQKIAESPNGEWQPIPGMRILVREEDIAGKTPREARLWFFRQWAEPLYHDGAKGLASLMTDPEMQKSLEDGIGPLSFISANTHNIFQKIFIVSGLVSLFFLGLFIYFSYRFGRFGNPGCVIFLSAIPILAILSGLSSWINNSTQNPTSGSEETIIRRYSQLAVDVLPDVVHKAIQIYTFLVLLGLGLMLIALICTIFISAKRKKTLEID